METRIPTTTTTARGIQDTVAKCRAAKALMSTGDYEAAREALGTLWGGIGERPDVEDLAPRDQAEVLLRVGALSGWLGSSGQVPGAQGSGKDLISESIRAFTAIGDEEMVAEAESDLALCYWREGAMDEARVWLATSLAKAKAPGNRVRILVRSAVVECVSNRYADALALLDQAAPLLDQVEDAVGRGCYHMHRAAVLRRIGGSENLDRALIENAAATTYFEQVNHRRYFARCENNTGNILRQLGRYEEALEHLERARHTFIELGDVGTAAQVNDTRARVFIDQQRFVDAEKIAFSAVSALETGDEQSLLAEALETQAVALARMGRFQSALGLLRRAAHIAQTAGDSRLSGEILLTILEEIKSFLSPSEITDIYKEADDRLPDTLEQETVSRLRACARLGSANTATPKKEETRGSFGQQVHQRESELINAALVEAGGSVTRAARILGLTHQGLCYIINHRHKDLLVARAPIRVRRKSIIKKR
jgi:tetratricopeptide (TPR) repeat protein